MKKIILISGILLIVNIISKAQSSTPGYYKSVAAINTAAIAGQLSAMHYTFLEDSIVVKDAKYYLVKSQNQKTAAWILLGGGAACTGIGILIFPKDYNVVWGTNTTSQESNATFSTILTIAGFASMLTSIPVFISSSINKRRAHAGVSYQKTGFGIPVKSDKEIAGITLSIPIGR